MLESVIKRHQLLLFHSRCGKNFGVVHDPVEQTVIFQLPSCSKTVGIFRQAPDIIFLVHPDRFQIANILVIVCDFAPCMVFCSGDCEDLAAGCFVEQKSGDHLSDIACPAHCRLNVARLFGDNDGFPSKCAAHGIRRLEGDKLIAHKRIGDRGTDGCPVFLRQSMENVFAAGFINTVVVGTAENKIVRGIDQPGRCFFDRVFLVVIDPVTGKIDVMTGIIQHQRQIIGEVSGRIDHEIHDAVIFLCQQLTQNIFVLGIRLEIRYVRMSAGRLVQGNSIHLIPHFRQTRHQIFAHCAGRTENQNFFCHDSTSFPFF